jgi:hypothetical protein
MRVYDNSSLHELLQQMKELHAPDRCEGPLNDAWQGMQSVYYRKGLTPQQKINNYWNVNSKNHKGLLKMLTAGGSTARDQFTARDQLWTICKEVDSSRKPTVDEPQLNAFIDGCTASQLQDMFNIMIVQWVWRERMIQAWKIQ